MTILVPYIKDLSTFGEWSRKRNTTDELWLEHMENRPRKFSFLQYRIALNVIFKIMVIFCCNTS